MPPPYKVAFKSNPYSAPGPAGVSFGTLTAEVGNARTQSLTVTDANGKPVAAPTLVWVWLSLNADGTDVPGVAATSLTAGTNGKKMADLTVGKIALFQTKSDGTLDVTITDSAVRTVYLAVAVADGLKVTSGIAFA